MFLPCLLVILEGDMTSCLPVFQVPAPFRLTADVPSLEMSPKTKNPDP